MILFSLTGICLSNDMLFGPFGTIGFAVGVPIVVLIVLRPFWGLLLIIVANQVDSLVSVPYFSSLGRLCGVFVGFGWLLNYFFKKTVLFDFMKFNRTLLLFLLSMGVSSALAAFPGRSAADSLTIALLVFMVLFLEDFIKDHKALNLFLLTVALSIGLSSLLGILQYESLLQGQETFGRVAFEQEGQAKRIAGITLNPNAYAVMLMSGIPALFFFVLNAKGRFLKPLSFLLFLTSVVSLGLTMSRTNIVGFGLFLCAFLMLSAKYKTISSGQFLILCFVLIVIAVVFYFFLFDVITTRSFAFNDGSSEHRFHMMQKGLALLKENPLFGVGFSNFEMLRGPGGSYGSIAGRPGHDILSVPFASTGLFGICIILALVYKTFKHFTSALRTFANHGEKRLLSLGITVESGFIALVISCFGNPIVFQRIFWIYMALGAILWRWSLANSRMQAATMQRGRPIRSDARKPILLKNRFRARLNPVRQAEEV